jgi:hypothetical protein
MQKKFKHDYLSYKKTHKENFCSALQIIYHASNDQNKKHKQPAVKIN